MSHEHTPTAARILSLPMVENDSGADTVRGYLCALLSTLWDEGEGFSGKRPFGNSGWECDLYAPLIKVGWLEGVVDDDGYIESVDDIAGHRLIASAIVSFRTAVEPQGVAEEPT